MEQAEFKRALAKFERQKQKRAAAALRDSGEDVPKVNVSLPFAEIKPVVKKDKPKEAARPRPLAMEISVSGPIKLSFTIDWAGALLGGQMNEPAMKVMFIKCLASMGRVTPK